MYSILRRLRLTCNDMAIESMYSFLRFLRLTCNCMAVDSREISFLAAAMEKTLRELETIWADMNFDTQHHESSGQTLLVARDELIEQLEGDQVTKFY